MDSPELPLVSGTLQYTNYVSTDNVSTTKLIMSETKRDVADNKNLGFRLRRRTELIGTRTRVSDMAFLLAILGIIITIVDTECQLGGIYRVDEPISVYLRVITSITTVGLLMSIIAYHAIGVKLRLVSQGLNNWRLVIDWTDVAKLTAELSVCAIHPLPFSSTPSLPMYVSEESNLYAFQVTMFPLNSLFTILMFLRIYLLMRFLVVHSALFRDTTVQSLGAMSNVNINAQFVFKALMTSMPGLCLVSIMATTLFVNSYSLRMCEYYILDGRNTGTFFMQAIWMTCVTFLTLGYGDIVPRTTCGRVLAIGTGMMGVGLMALCVAVLTRKLEQTRGEKYVHTFVQQIHMDKQYKHAAARVVMEFLTICRLRRIGIPEADDRLVQHRRKLLTAVKMMTRSRYVKTHLAESLTGPVEISKNVNEIYDLVENIKEEQDEFKDRIGNMERMITSMHQQMQEMRSILTGDINSSEST